MKNVAETQESSQEKTVLWKLAREGARKMIQAALIQEQEDFLKEHGNLLLENGKRQFVKNGFLFEQQIKMPTGAIPLQAPRVRNRNKDDQSIQFTSKMLPKFLRCTKEMDELIPFLYLKGFSTNDFTEVLTTMFGTSVSLLFQFR